MMFRTSGSNWRRDALIAAVALVILVLLPFVANKGIVFVAGTLVLHIVFGLSWNLMFGQTGLVSFGHASFFAIGGYAFAWTAKMFRNCIHCCSSPERGCWVRSWLSSWGSSRCADPWASISRS